MELTVKRKVIAMAAAAAIGLTITAARAFHDFNATSPRIDFLATPARQLHLGMTAQDVTRVMGDAPRETIFAAEGANMRRLEFPGAIPSKVTLTDGRLSRVTLDAFRVDKGDLPAYSHKAWPGMAASAVRRVLGEPADVLHHTLFGINVDQWVYSRAGLADLSMFFRADRVVARAVGREVPADLFVVDLPSPPEAKSEGPMSTPHLGLTASDMQEIYGEAKFRVDYVFNGQPASRVVFETGAKGTFACITFVDGVVTDFENLGQMPDDASFLGR
jgi:hypothetical protein